MKKYPYFTLTLSKQKDAELIQAIKAITDRYKCSENKAAKALAVHGIAGFKALSDEEKAISLL